MSIDHAFGFAAGAAAGLLFSLPFLIDGIRKWRAASRKFDEATVANVEAQRRLRDMTTTA